MHAYVKNGKYVSSTTRMNRSRRPFTGDGSSFAVDLAANAILWYEI
ncbi:MAG: hypothetical protein ACLUPG_19125 [Roseburia faecis]